MALRLLCMPRSHPMHLYRREVTGLGATKKAQPMWAPNNPSRHSYKKMIQAHLCECSHYCRTVAMAVTWRRKIFVMLHTIKVITNIYTLGKSWVKDKKNFSLFWYNWDLMLRKYLNERSSPILEKKILFSSRNSTTPVNRLCEVLLHSPFTSKEVGYNTRHNSWIGVVWPLIWKKKGRFF